ncbi:MAG: adenosylcobinamide-GDP ribazoletransferase [Nitrospirae bacterium]|nr:adenosylcobinamide-GDP ribazoletransferase [Nitrospirota bacterium]
MKKILLAFQFLTIIPLKEIKDVSEKEMGGSSAFFPVVGAVEGLLLVLSATFFMKIIPAELANGLVILIMVLVNGGLHLDGLADTFDAIASRSNKEKKLAIMKDSTVGPFGVISIVLVILLKYISMNALFSNASRAAYCSSLFLMPVLSRWVMVPAIFHGKPARQDGLGKIFIENTGIKELLTATLLAGMAFICAELLLDMPSDGHSSLVTRHWLLMLPVLYIFSLITVWFCNKKFGGMTGDTFGAISEISGILFLITAVICLQNSI